MAPVTIEILRGTASDAFLANPRDKSMTYATSELLKRLRKDEVYLSGRHENKTQAYALIVWASNPDQNAALRTSLKPVFAGQPEVLRFEMPHDPHPMLSSPITELTLFRLHDPAYRAELHKRVDDAYSYVQRVPESNGPRGVTWGPALQGRDEMYVTMLGWDSIDAHMAHIERNHDGMEVIAKILVVAALEIGHFKFFRV